jgi:hypothetical protein
MGFRSSYDLVTQQNANKEPADLGKMLLRGTLAPGPAVVFASKTGRGILSVGRQIAPLPFELEAKPRREE